MRCQSEKNVLLYRTYSFIETCQGAATTNVAISRTTTAALHEIEPQNVSEIERWAGRGSFGVVKIHFYRGMKVVSILPKTVLEDVKNEAEILTKLCHPYLPYLFGVCTKEKPYRLVMQFHGIGTE